MQEKSHYTMQPNTTGERYKGLIRSPLYKGVFSLSEMDCAGMFVDDGDAVLMINRQAISNGEPTAWSWLLYNRPKREKQREVVEMMRALRDQGFNEVYYGTCMGPEFYVTMHHRAKARKLNQHSLKTSKPGESLKSSVPPKRKKKKVMTKRRQKSLVRFILHGVLFPKTPKRRATRWKGDTSWKTTGRAKKPGGKKGFWGN